MVKADSYIVPNPDEQRKHQNRPKSGQQEPLSGSKKTKQQNHSRHNNNPEG
jgi:small acid-soluble spore protein P (minor)